MFVPSEIYRFDKRIRIYGTGKEIKEVKKALSSFDFSEYDNHNARLIIQEIISQYNLKATVTLMGNTVWNKDRIIRNVKRIIRNNDMTLLSEYTYSFLHNNCGSISHYNKYGWIETYPTIEDFKRFFKQNEYGSTVYDFISERIPDSKVIVSEIELLLEEIEFAYTIMFYGKNKVGQQTITAQTQEEANVKARQLLLELGYDRFICIPDVDLNKKRNGVK